jgi:hypothetical protein
MSVPTDSHDSGTAPDCTTSSSFEDHGLADGESLVRETHYRLVDAGVTFEPTEAFFDALESAFVWSYMSTTDESGVPEHVDAAIEDARALTHEAFAEDRSADLRTEVIPAFYQRVAGFHCIYR